MEFDKAMGDLFRLQVPQTEFANAGGVNDIAAVREVIEAKGTAKEKLLKTQMAALGIDYDSLTPEESVVQVGILQKSKLLRNSISQRGKASPHPGHKRGKKRR